MKMITLPELREIVKSSKGNPLSFEVEKKFSILGDCQFKRYEVALERIARQKVLSKEGYEHFSIDTAKEALKIKEQEDEKSK